MCLAVPGKVIRIENTNAVVDVLGVTRSIAVDLIRDLQVGDYLMVHAGYAIEKIDEEEAVRTLELYRELGAVLEEQQDVE